MAAKPSIIIDPHFRKMAEIFSPADLVRLKDTADVLWGKDEPMPSKDLAAALPEALAVVCADWPYDNALLKSASSLTTIFDVSGGFPRMLDYNYCQANHIRVLSVAPAFGRQVAEMALGMALAAGREICAGDAAFRAGKEKWLHAGNTSTFMLFDQPVGFIGYGSIARCLRPLLAPFGCSIAVYDPWLSEGYLRSQGVTPMNLERLLETSKVVFVLAVPSSENRALLSRAMLERMQPHAALVLISRAHVVDFDALTELVVDGKIKAAIDVFPTEPLALDHPIRSASGAVLSAHRAGSVKEGLWEIGQMLVDDLEAIVHHLPPQRLQIAQPELVNRYTTLRVTSK